MLVEILLTWTVLVAGRGVWCDSLPSEAPEPDHAALAARKNHNYNPLSSAPSIPPFLLTSAFSNFFCQTAVRASEVASACLLSSSARWTCLWYCSDRFNNWATEEGNTNGEKISKPLLTQGNLFFRKILQATKLLSFLLQFEGCSISGNLLLQFAWCLYSF